jgi:hypothetical protein
MKKICVFESQARGEFLETHNLKGQTTILSNA